MNTQGTLTKGQMQMLGTEIYPFLKLYARRLQKCKMKINLRNRQNTSFRFDKASYQKDL